MFDPHYESAIELPSNDSPPDSWQNSDFDHLMFNNAWSPLGTLENFSWNDFTSSLQARPHQLVTDKLSAKLFAPWTPKTGATGRKDEAVGQAVMLVIDLDKIDTRDIEVVEAWCYPYAAVLHTTHSHDAAGRGCFRVYMPLNEPIAPHQYKAVHARVLATLPGLMQGLDPKCSEVSRCYFMPSCPPDRISLARTTVVDGVAIHTPTFLQAPKPILAIAGATGPLAGPLLPIAGVPPRARAGMVSPAAIALAGKAPFVLPEVVKDGEGRESTLLKFAGHLRGKGFDQAMIERTLLDYNVLHIDPPLAEDVVLNRARRHEQKGTHLLINDDDLPEPQDISETLPPVPALDMLMLPKTVGAYVQDVAERMSCPVDFPAVAAIVAIAAAIGGRVHCKPYSKGTWMVPAGAWGMVVSQPSAIKTPPLSEMLRPLHNMDKLAATQYAKEIEQYQIKKQIYDHTLKVAIRAGPVPVGLVAPIEPTMTRHIVNDSTYEMLIVIAAANPNGFLIWRDELQGWFHSLNKDNQKEARGLYLTGWSGTESYATDRIGRGHVRADRVNLSLIGTIQPNVLRGIVYDAVAGGSGDDGLVARFQLAVYPDPVRKYVKVDRYPNLKAMQHYEDLIRRMATLDPTSVGAQLTPDGIPYLPFHADAQVIFDDWRQQLEDRIRAVDSEEHPAMLAHLGKYRSLFPKLALVLHLAAGKTGPIGPHAATRALVWTEYLEAHARRIYHTATNRTMQCAVALANKIKAGKLADGFTKSDVLVKEWAGLRTADEVATALTVLRDGSWLTVVEDRRTGGRPAERHYISTKVKRAV